MRPRIVVLAIAAATVLAVGIGGIAAADLYSSADDDTSAEPSSETLYLLDGLDVDGDDGVAFEIVEAEETDRMNLSRNAIVIESPDESSTADDVKIVAYEAIQTDAELELEEIDSDVLVVHPVDD